MLLLPPPTTDALPPAGTDGPGAGPGPEVRVLGPVEVVGLAHPLRRSRSLDLLAYLALHPRGVATDAWAAALWPERRMAPSTLHSTVSAARRALGRTAAGHDHLPHGRRVLRLAPSVGSDWAAFQARVATGCPADWAAALALVRGRPFGGLDADWPVMEGHAAEMEEAAAGVAHRLACHRLDRGDARGAVAAARAGLRASPYDERLFRVLLRAADAEGNPAALEAVMAQLSGLLSDRPPGPGRRSRAGTPAARRARTEVALTLVHPDTASLYQELARRPGAAGEPRPRL